MHKNKPDWTKLITPEMAEVVAHIRQWNEEHPATSNYLQDYMDERVFWNDGGPVPAKVIEVEIEGPYGKIPCRLHYPRISDQPMGMMLYAHGGSLYLGNNDTHSRIMRTLTEKSDTVVIGVDYHLAPQNRFPKWIEECVVATKYFRAHAAEYGLDANDVSFAGDSAGAWLSMATMLWLRDEDPDISYVTSLLLYYGLYGMYDSPTQRLYGNEIDGMMREYDEKLYPASIVDEEDVKSPHCDLLYNDLTQNVPPCFICTGTIDPLADNSPLLYAILKDKGMPSELKLYPGIMHSFLHYSRMLPAAMEAMELGGEYVKQQRAKKQA